jgi:hypothetical protein
MNKYALGALTFWTIYNTIFMTVVMSWLGTPNNKWILGYLIGIAATCLMMAVTVGNQNKEIKDETIGR